jgi:hypothetical protein
MTPLHCPHCNQALAANPIGRWFAHFQCPHCHGPLQFDMRTNTLGVAASAAFFAMAWALMGPGEGSASIAWGAGAAWLLALGLTYALRRVVKG